MVSSWPGLRRPAAVPAHRPQAADRTTDGKHQDHPRRRLTGNCARAAPSRHRHAAGRAASAPDSSRHPRSSPAGRAPTTAPPAARPASPRPCERDQQARAVAKMAKKLHGWRPGCALDNASYASQRPAGAGGRTGRQRPQARRAGRRRRLGLLPPTPQPGPRARQSGRDRLRRSCASACCGSTWRSQGSGPMPRRLAILAWRQRELLRSALTPAEGAWPDQSRAIDRSTSPPSCATTCPTGWPRRCWRAWGRRVLALGRGAQREPRRWTCASTPSRPNARQPRLSWPQRVSRQCPRRTRPGACGWMASRRSNKLDVFTSGAVEVQDEGAASCWWVAGPRCARDGGGLCAGPARRSPLAPRCAQHRAALRLRRVGPPARCTQARLARSGPSNVYPAQIAHERDDLHQAPGRQADRVLVDAPCSASAPCAATPT